MTIAVRYGAQRQQFGPAEGQEVSVLDYSSQQLKLMPMLATAYALHFTAAFLVNQYTEAKRTKAEELIADVHSLSAGKSWLNHAANPRSHSVARSILACEMPYARFLHCGAVSLP